jgi:hypothetical protein
LLLAAGLILILAQVPARGQDARDPITFETLLTEMVDRSAVARWPAVEYRMLQSSSWDRRSREGEGAEARPAADKGDEGWFANGDYGKYLRTEERAGRTEYVMMDVQGPGAIVRIWSANPNLGGTLRIYLDGAEEPVIEESFETLTNGSGPVASPLSAQRSRGHNLYLPIPYANGCRVTLDGDKDGRVYYIINHRQYADGTAIQTLRPDDLRAGAAAIEAAQARLSSPGGLEDEGASRSRSSSQTHGMVSPGGSLTKTLGEGPMALRELKVKVQNVEGQARDMALRSLVLRIEADDEGTLVEAPLGDFFGSGVGLNPYEGWYRTVGEDGSMTCRWVMPFQRSMTLAIVNHGQEPVSVAIEHSATGWEWDDRSMYFHANFHQQRDIPTRPRRDFNYLTVEGQGLYVGDTLAVANPTPTWWGEGDEKVYVDGEAFPSHIGTGTEDYYGYAWCWPDPFKAPFHAQPRCDGPDNFGHTTNTRVRSLDAIPFRDRFQMDMEVWHWQDVKVSYAVTTYWYGRPGAKAAGPAAAAEMDLAVPELPEMHRLAGVIEGEALKVLGKSGDFPVGRQMLFGAFEGQWSNGGHLWLRPAEPRGWVDLALPTPDAGEQKLFLWMTRAPDYGIVQLHINGQPLGEPVDLYSAKVEPAGPLEIGVFKPQGAETTLRVEIVGKNDASKGALVGLDAVKLEPAQ